MDSNSSLLVLKVINEFKSDFGFEEDIAKSLIEIGRNSDTVEEFSLRSKEILLKLPLKYALSIFETIRENFPSKPKNFFKYSDFPERTGWLNRIAAARTAFMKNLRDPVPNTNRYPLFESNKEIFKSTSESRALVVISWTVCDDAARLAQCLDEAEAEISAAKRVDREVSCGVREKNSLDDQNLFRHILDDKSLSDCSAAVITEARRRTAATDILYGLLKKVFRWRSDFLVIFDSSAIVEREKLSRFFSCCRVVDIPRISFPVRILHSKHPISDYLAAAAFLTVEIHLKKPIGDIIVFLAGEEEIVPVRRSIIERIRIIRGCRDVPELEVLMVYSEKNDPRLLEPSNNYNRKVILTANNVEAMFEFDNILYAIDCGFEERISDNPKLETNTVAVFPISQDSAARRAGRAGRVGPGGQCYRLYTEAAYLEEMGPTTLPEIQRTNLGEAVLRGKSFDIKWDFIDRPPMESIVKASRQLYCLEAIDDRGFVTSRGRFMAEFPVGPIMSRILIAGVDFRCSEEVLTIIAMVLTGNVFCWPKEEEELARLDLKRAEFFRSEGDHLTLLAIFEAWKENGFSRQWCLDNLVEYETMNKANEFRNQLICTMNRLKLEIVSAEKNYTNIRKAITAGLFFHAAKWDPQEGCYRAVVDDRTVHINPRSALCKIRPPEWVVHDNLHVMSDGKEYMIGVTSTDQNWLFEMAPRYFGNVGPTRMTMSRQENRGRGKSDSTVMCNEPKRVKRSG